MKNFKTEICDVKTKSVIYGRIDGEWIKILECYWEEPRSRDWEEAHDILSFCGPVIVDWRPATMPVAQAIAELTEKYKNEKGVCFA